MADDTTRTLAAGNAQSKSRSEAQLFTARLVASRPESSSLV
jgi:hypothetical protein